MKKDTVVKLYSFCIVLAFSLLFFANAENNKDMNIHLGVGKSFFIPIGAALIFSFFLPRNVDRVDRRLYFYMGITAVSWLTMTRDITFNLDNGVLRIVCAIICFRDLRNIDLKYLIKYIGIVSPIIILLHFVLVNPFDYVNRGVRYGGFYGDPNYLAMALNLLIIFCYMNIRKYNKRIPTAIWLVTIFGCIVLVLLGASRAGIIATTVTLISILLHLAKTNKKLVIYIAITAALGSGAFVVKMGDAFARIEERFSVFEDKNYKNPREIDFICSYNLLNDRPELIFLGIGYGNSTFAHIDYASSGYYNPYRIHNTYLSTLIEQGIFAFILLVSIIIKTIKENHRRRNRICFTLLVAEFFLAFTLACNTFMPFWVILFILSNKFFSEDEFIKSQWHENSNIIYMHRQVQPVLQRLL